MQLIIEENKIDFKDMNILQIDNRVKYDFIGTILYKDNHFSCIIKNPTMKKGKSFIKLYGYYYHNGLKNGGKLIKLPVAFSRYNTEEKSYIIAYKRSSN